MTGRHILIVASIVIIAWGIAHIVPTRSVVRGFGSLSQDNRRIITMEWVAEGLTLCFVGLLVLLATVLHPWSEVTATVVRVCAGMLIVMATWTSLTGARTSITPIKICPMVKTIVAVLFILGSVL